MDRKTIPVLNDERVAIQIVPEYRAAKKFVPLIEEYKTRHQLLITVDDDFYYAQNLLETLVDAFLKMNQDPNHKRAVGILGYRLNEDLSWGQSMTSDAWWKFSEFSYYYIRGFRIAEPYQVAVTTGGGGVCMDSYWFKDANPPISDFSRAPEHAKIVDDIWMNGYFSKLGIERFVVPIQDQAIGVVRKSVVEDKLSSTSSMDRYTANNNMIQYFKEYFEKDKMIYLTGGRNAPKYRWWIYIGVVEPVKEWVSRLWIDYKFPRH